MLQRAYSESNWGRWGCSPDLGSRVRPGQTSAIQEATPQCVSAQCNLVSDWCTGRELWYALLSWRSAAWERRQEKQLALSTDPVFSLASGYKIDPRGGAARSSTGPAQYCSAGAVGGTEANTDRPFVSNLVRYLCKIKLVNVSCDPQP